MIMPVNGEYKGKIFSTDNETCFYLIFDNFNDFYNDWLDDIVEQKSLKHWRAVNAKVRAYKLGHIK